MRMMLTFGAALVAMVEAVVFVVVGRAIGVPWTLALVLATSVFGCWLVLRQGRRAWTRFRAELAVGELPTETLGHGALLLVAGLLLLAPGFVTDLVGFALLLPAVREPVRTWFVDRYRRRRAFVW